MRYKLNKEYIKIHGGEMVSFSRFAKVGGQFNLGNKDTVNSVAKNQDLLRQLYDLGKAYVDEVSQEGKSKVKSKSKNKIKKVCNDDSKEINCEQKEEQILPEASEE